jgi:nucleoside-diphosphate-sugar epimerase
MKKVLVTGATGFIGHHTIPLLLKKDYEVHIVSSQQIPTNKKNSFWHKTDLLNSHQTSSLISEVRPSHLLHFAWYTEHGKYWESPENIQWVQASLNLLRAFHECGGQRVLFAGTCAEYDWGHSVYSEFSTPKNPSTLYGVCKHSLQLITNSFCQSIGLSAAWGRLFFLYGPNEHPDRLVSFIIQSLLKNKPTPCTSGEQVRDFLYTKDAASAFVSVLGSAVEGPINIGSGDAISLKEIIQAIGKKVDRESLIRFGEKPSPLNDPPSLVPDIKRLKEEVNWKPSFNLDEGLNQTIQWWENKLE